VGSNRNEILNKDENDVPTKVAISRTQKSDALFLNAVLAEYNKLNAEILYHQKNANYIVAITFGGLVALLGTYGVIGTLSLLLTPIVVSFFAILVLAEHHTTYFIRKYVKEEIEEKKLRTLFPNNPPIGWETYNLSQDLKGNTIFMAIVFILSLGLCVACLVAVTFVFWNEVLLNIIYRMLYFGGWVMIGFYGYWALFMFRRLFSLVKNL
jgi:hypothetical protein